MASSTKPAIESNLDAHFKAVSDALEVEAGNTTFAVGGLVHIPAGYITLRWDTNEQNHCRKASFPVESSNPTSHAAFTKFLEDSEPATYGVGGQEVLDETYRKAGKMSADRFSTSFNLSEWGIMEAINQALVHGRHGGIKAELYNVNVYSGPSGKFKPHVDTPRSKSQMGSLVVCLPAPHQGGQLAVRHQGREVTFDWATNSAIPTAVQWAAFFSDCEHEVFQVTSGHRITLTYNLYWTPPMSLQTQVIQPEQLSFFPALKDLFSCPEFLPDGGLIGFTCTHAYPHRSKAASDTLQDNLKGIDMLVYQTLKHLTGPSGKVLVTDYLNENPYDKEDNLQEGATERDAIGEVPSDGPFIGGDFGEDLVDPTTLTITSRFRVVREEGQATIWKRKRVQWLNHHPDSKKHNRELALAFITYGNEPSMDCTYSTAVIIAHFHRGPDEQAIQDAGISKAQIGGGEYGGSV